MLTESVVFSTQFVFSTFVEVQDDDETVKVVFTQDAVRAFHSMVQYWKQHYYENVLDNE